MYEPKNGPKRLARAVEDHLLPRKQIIKQLAQVLHYDPAQLEQDLQALVDQQK